MLRIEICAAYDKTKHMQISQAPILFFASLFWKAMPSLKKEETIYIYIKA